MDNQNVQNETQADVYNQETTVWSILAQLTFFAGNLFPMAGIITAWLIYSQVGPRSPLLQENARLALNVRLTETLLFLATLFMVLVLGGATWLGTAFDRKWIYISAFICLIVGIALGCLAVLYALYALVATLLNCLAINNGRLANYRYVIEFVKARN